MRFDKNSYVPTLAVRASEMNGLEFLPGLSKDRLMPCFLLAPWVSSLQLSRTLVRIEKAFPKRNFFLDLDRDYQFTNLENGPQQELLELKNSRNGFENWCEFVSTYEYVIPCLQTTNQGTAELRTQIGNYRDMGREFCVRIVRERFPENISGGCTR